MSGFFSYDNKLMQAGHRLTDLIWLNILTLLCCLPVFTAGAALCAMHTVLIKIYHRDESPIAAGFFKAFVQNFKQATLLWSFYLVSFVLIIGDFYLMAHKILEYSTFFLFVLLILSILVLLSFCWVFPLQARYDNKVRYTLFNAFALGIRNFPRSILMILIHLLPLAVIYFLTQLTPAVIAMGLTIPASASSSLYCPVFKKAEAHVEALSQQAAEAAVTPEETELPETAEAVESQ